MRTPESNLRTGFPKARIRTHSEKETPTSIRRSLMLGEPCGLGLTPDSGSAKGRCESGRSRVKIRDPGRPRQNLLTQPKLPAGDHGTECSGTDLAPSIRGPGVPPSAPRDFPRASIVLPHVRRALPLPESWTQNRRPCFYPKAPYTDDTTQAVANKLRSFRGQHGKPRRSDILLLVRQAIAPSYLSPPCREEQGIPFSPSTQPNPMSPASFLAREPQLESRRL